MKASPRSTELPAGPKTEAEPAPPAVAGLPTSPLPSPGSNEEKPRQLRDMGLFDEPENRAAIMIEMAHGEVSRAIADLQAHWHVGDCGRRVSAKQLGADVNASTGSRVNARQV